MSEHLTQSEITLLRQQSQAIADLPRISQHLVNCSECQKGIGNGKEWQAVTAFIREDWLQSEEEVEICLTTTELADYINHTLTKDDAEMASLHLQQCCECEQALEEARLIQRDMRLKLEYTPPQKNGWRALWEIPVWRYSLQSAVAVLLLVTIGYIVFKSATPLPASSSQSVATNNYPSPTPDSTPDVQREAESVIVIQDGNTQIRMDADGRLHGLESLSPSEKLLVKQALLAKTMAQPKELESLRSSAGELMSGQAQPKSFALLEPFGVMISNTRPVFRWQPLAGADNYKVMIIESDLEPVASSPQLRGTEWEIPTPLERGKFYQWQVIALKDGKEILSPTLGQPEAKFFVLDQKRAEQIERAKQSPHQSRLLLGILYAQSGLRAESEEQFRLLLKENPGSIVVQRLLNSLK